MCSTLGGVGWWSIWPGASGEEVWGGRASIVQEHSKDWWIQRLFPCTYGCSMGRVTIAAAPDETRRVTGLYHTSWESTFRRGQKACPHWSRCWKWWCVDDGESDGCNSITGCGFLPGLHGIQENQAANVWSNGFCGWRGDWCRAGNILHPGWWEWWRFCRTASTRRRWRRDSGDGVRSCNERHSSGWPRTCCSFDCLSRRETQVIWEVSQSWFLASSCSQGQRKTQIICQRKRRTKPENLTGKDLV